MAKNNGGLERGGSRIQAHKTDVLLKTSGNADYSVSRSPRKPTNVFHNPLIEDELPQAIPAEGEHIDCPRCARHATRLWNHIERDGCLIENTDEWQEITKSIAGGQSLFVRQLRTRPIVYFYCPKCGLEGWHDRNPKKREGGR